MSSVVRQTARPVTPLGILVEQLEETVRLGRGTECATEIVASCSTPSG